MANQCHLGVWVMLTTEQEGIGMCGREMGLSLVVMVGIAVLADDAFGEAEPGHASAGATRVGHIVVAGNSPGPPGKFLPPPPPRTLQRAPEGTAQRLIDAQASKAIRRNLFRKHYPHPGTDYCKKSPHRPNCRH
jgi:hypothetical protein